jgi:hypothetical protein
LAHGQEWKYREQNLPSQGFCHIEKRDDSLGELILAASDKARTLNIILLDEVSGQMSKLSKKVRKEKEILERAIKNEVVIDVPPGKRVRIYMTVDKKT